ncbi:MAG TPA: hypothetical protein DIS74_09340 [Bacteroidales bacterium]|nr:hypothetical protein [Bacteroidales bacterium]
MYLSWHSKGIGPVIEIIPPEDRGMVTRDYGMEVPVEDAVAAFLLCIGPVYELLLIIKQLPDLDVKFLFCHKFRGLFPEQI